MRVPAAEYYENQTEPTGEIVPLADVKAQLNVTFNADDALIQQYINVAISRVEAYTRRVLLPRTVRGEFPALYSARFVELKRSPCSAVTAVEYWTGENFDTLTADTDYFIRRAAGYWRVYFRGFFPFQRGTFYQNEIAYPIRVTFSAGYENAAAIPDAFKTAIAQTVAQLYDSRGDCEECGQSCPNGSKLPGIARATISHLRVDRIFA